MLAKQAWRLIKNPDSLLARVLKAKYYPDCNLCDASLGRSPSYIWRSIHRASFLIGAGSRWRVGSGENIRIWQDRWLSRGPSFRPGIPIARSFNVERVSDLFIPGMLAWNKILIDATFAPDDAKEILNIPLGLSPRSDSLIWHFSHNGQFSVKSAYHLALKLSSEELGNNGVESASKVWFLIWKLKIAPKIKIFLWRICHNILPTCDNLIKRRCQVSASCSICDYYWEDMRHALVSCSFARQVWALSNIPWAMISVLEDNICREIEKAICTLSEGECSKLCSILWSIWWFRNKKWAEDLNSTPLEVLSFATRFSDDQQLACHAPTLQASNNVGEVGLGRLDGEIIVHKWQKPPRQVIKVNFDGALFKEKNEVGIGVVARDENGKVIAWGCTSFQGPQDAEYAESMAALGAIRMAQDFGWSKIIIEGDCSTLIRKIQCSNEDESYLGNIVEKVKALAIGFNLCKFSFVKREANCVAHVLACNAATACAISGSFPTCMDRFVNSDLS